MVLLPTLDFLTLRLSGWYDKEHSKSFGEQLDSLEASRMKHGFPIAEITFVEK
jgi:hypothetical protein